MATLDGAFYSLTSQELDFFKAQTGIQDESALKEHLMKVQSDAWEVCHVSAPFSELRLTCCLM